MYAVRGSNPCADIFLFSLLLLFLFLFSFLLPPFPLFSSPSSLLIRTRVLIFLFLWGWVWLGVGFGLGFVVGFVVGMVVGVGVCWGLFGGVGFCCARVWCLVFGFGWWRGACVLCVCWACVSAWWRVCWWPGWLLRPGGGRYGRARRVRCDHGAQSDFL